MDPQTIVLNNAKPAPHLAQLFTEYRVSPEVMAMCGNKGVDTVAAPAGLAFCKKDFRPAFTLFFGFDPTRNGPAAVQMAHIIGAYGAALIWEVADIKPGSRSRQVRGGLTLDWCTM